MKNYYKDQDWGGMIGKTYLEKGKPVMVLIRWNGKDPRNVLIQREDGSRVVRPFRGLRRAK
jgi:acetyl esterase